MHEEAAMAARLCLILLMRRSGMTCMRRIQEGREGRSGRKGEGVRLHLHVLLYVGLDVWMRHFADSGKQVQPQ